MRKTFLVLKYEIITILSSKSFWFAAVGIPLIGALIFSIAGALTNNAEASQLLEGLISSPVSKLSQGYVDKSGLIVALPQSVSADKLIAYADEDAAYQALAAGKIGAFYILPPDFIETGNIVLVQKDFNPLSSSGNYTFERVIQYNLLGGNVALVDRIAQPMVLRIRSLSTEPQRGQENIMTFFLPYIVTMIYYILILGSATLLLNSVAKEKENKVIEVLMMSVTPHQLLNGKIIGLGLLGLFQAAFWVGTSFILLRLSGRTFALSEAFQLPTSFLVWGLIFFVLGYALYAALMAGVGALVPNLREASQATFIVILPLLVPMLLISVLIDTPNGLLAIILSLIPFTSPVTMMTRLAAGEVPLWQLILSVGLLIVSTIVVLRVVANMFRAQTLLSGQGFNIKHFFLVFKQAFVDRA